MAIMKPSFFSNLPFSSDILKNLESLGYHEMTQIQAKSLPAILANQDVIAKAKTGSGKTAAFGLGLLSKIDTQYLHEQALVICPTRELADQVSMEIRRLARLTPNIRVLTLCGGKPMRAQIESLTNGAHIIVGTPGRLWAHIEKRSIVLKTIHTLVLDEADRMLDMGFYDDIIHIIDALPKQKQTLLFSATYPDSIAEISHLIQKNPVEITLEAIDEPLRIDQVCHEIEEHDKNEALVSLLKNHNPSSAIIFCKTKRQCDEVAIHLCQNGFQALAIHSDLEQRERDEVLVQFSNNSCPILVATDVAARGLDIKDLQLVMNYDLPISPEIYVHRIGRTGRAGKSGLAISLYTHREGYKIKDIEDYIKTSLKISQLNTQPQQNEHASRPSMRTLCINGGKKNKVRPGDILGALTGDGGISADMVGKINIFDFYSYVAINQSVAQKVLNRLQTGKIKGRSFKIRFLDTDETKV